MKEGRNSFKVTTAAVAAAVSMTGIVILITMIHFITWYFPYF